MQCLKCFGELRVIEWVGFYGLGAEFVFWGFGVIVGVFGDGYYFEVCFFIQILEYFLGGVDIGVEFLFGYFVGGDVFEVCEGVFVGVGDVDVGYMGVIVYLDDFI